MSILDIFIDLNFASLVRILVKILESFGSDSRLGSANLFIKWHLLIKDKLNCFLLRLLFLLKIISRPLIKLLWSVQCDSLVFYTISYITLGVF